MCPVWLEYYPCVKYNPSGMIKPFSCLNVRLTNCQIQGCDCGVGVGVARSRGSKPRVLVGVGADQTASIPTPEHFVWICDIFAFAGDNLHAPLGNYRGNMFFYSVLCLYIGESGHTPDTFSLDVIYSTTIQVRRTTNTAAVGLMCGLHNYRKTSELT